MYRSEKLLVGNIFIEPNTGEGASGNWSLKNTFWYGSTNVEPTFEGSFSGNRLCADKFFWGIVLFTGTVYSHKLVFFT